MPTYLFRDIDGYEFEKNMPMNEREQFLLDNPNLKQLVTQISYVSDPGSGWRNKLKKTNPGYTEKLKKISDMPGSKIDFGAYG